MIRFLFIISFLIAGSTGHTQCLSFQFDEIGYEPATCRLHPWQSGNGVVYASVTGGTPPYSYQWTNLQTGQTSNNTTWGGLNVGTYQIYAHDSMGCFLIDTIQIDSILPVSGFEIFSADFDTTGTLAILPFQGTLEVDNFICELAQPFPGIDADTLFWWKVGASAWTVGYCHEEVDFEILSEGLFEISLVTLNKNGCSDTATVILNAALPTYAPLQPEVFCDYATGQTYVNCISANSSFYLYDLDGTCKQSQSLQAGVNLLQLPSGVSYFLIVDAFSSEVITRGKLVCAY